MMSFVELARDFIVAEEERQGRSGLNRTRTTFLICPSVQNKISLAFFSRRMLSNTRGAVNVPFLGFFQLQ